MQKDININDIAQYAGVSVSTVSRVMNNHPDVSCATRELVLEVIKRHGYIPNDSARSLKRESFKAIGIVVKGFTNPFFSRMLHVIYQELAQWDYLPLLQPVDPHMDEVEAAIILGKEKKPRGMMFLGGNFVHSHERLALLEAPYVMVTSTMHEGVNRETFSSVTIDDYQEAYRAVDGICKAGHKRIALIGHSPDDLSIGKLRLDGFMQALADNGLPAGPSCVAYAQEYSMAGGYRAAKALLAQPESSYTCLFCISDIMALGALRAIHEAGIAVPGTLSVVGFDGIAQSEFSIPSLTTLRQPDQQMAQDGLRILLEHLERGMPHRHVVYPTAYQPGESFRALTGE